MIADQLSSFEHEYFAIPPALQEYVKLGGLQLMRDAYLTIRHQFRGYFQRDHVWLNDFITSNNMVNFT